MITNAEKSWYIIYTKPRCEKKVAETLVKRGIEHYTPLVYRTQGHDKKKIIGEPLFASYLFVKVAIQQLETIKNISGVMHLLYWLGSPAVVNDEEIVAMKDFLHQHSNVQVEKSVVRIGNSVKVMQGQSMQRQGKIVQISANTVKTELPSIGYTLVARVNSTFKTETAKSHSFSMISEK